MRSWQASADEKKVLGDRIEEAVYSVTLFTQEAKKAAAVATNLINDKGTTTGHQVLLMQVIPQGSEESVPLISLAELMRQLDMFEKVYGRDSKPKE